MCKNMLIISLRYASSNNEKIIVRIDTFNEFNGATGIEPTVKEGFISSESLFQKVINSAYI